ncbi:MAG: hypothetical protein ACREBG_15800 [Pyrinomonadaceae bacterium]
MSILLLLLPLLLNLGLANHTATSAVQNQSPIVSDQDPSVVVVGFKWSKSRLTVDQADSAGTIPAAAMLPANKNFERNRRINDPAGVRDPIADSVDGRSAQLEKNVQEARNPKPKPVDGFGYRVKVQNTSSKVIEILFWEYQFIDPTNPTIMTRRQFLCAVNIKPNKDRELQAFGLSGPSDVVTVESLASKSATPLQEKVVINRVEYADDSIWQRKDWKFAEVRLSYARVVRTPWGTEMCRAL